MKVKTQKRITSARKTLSSGFSGAYVGIRRNLSSSWKRIRNKEILKGLIKLFLQTPVDAFLLTGGKIVSAFQVITGIEAIGRTLTNSETETLRKIFRESLVYSRIRIKEDKLGFFRMLHAPFTHGDTIYVQPNWVHSENDKIQLFVHESVHIWQHQNRGTNYLSESIFAQTIGMLRTGDRGYGYDFVRGIAEGKSFEKLNPEQQASLIETAYFFGFHENETERFELNGNDYTNYLVEALKIIRKPIKVSSRFPKR